MARDSRIVTQDCGFDPRQVHREGNILKSLLAKNIEYVTIYLVGDNPEKFESR